MLNDIYNKLLNDKRIKKIYDDIEKIEDKNGGWAYHNYSHVSNVTLLSSNILLSLNCSEEEILKTKIACLFHDVGALEGKDNHAYRSYEFTKKYFLDNNIYFDGIDDVLEAIRIHSDGFDTNNIIALSLILADKLDIKKTRITKEGAKVIGNRQYSHIDDILINILDNCFIINFITDNNFNIKEFNDYYFTKKVFNAVKSFSNKMNLNYKILINNNEMIGEK